MEVVLCIAIGYVIGAIIGYLWDKRVSSPDYGINGKKEIETYMSDKYGQFWLEQFKSK